MQPPPSKLSEVSGGAQIVTFPKNRTAIDTTIKVNFKQSKNEENQVLRKADHSQLSPPRRAIPDRIHSTNTTLQD
jgi:hypothetical protein